MLEDFFLRLALFLAPVYVANASPMLFGGRTPLDLNTSLNDGKKLFGEGKTIKGTLGGIGMGTIAAVLIASLFPQQSAIIAPNYALFGFAVSCGALAGDLAASFFKRRLGLERGTKLEIVDQLDFIAGSVLFGLAFFVPTALELAALVVLTLVLHRLTNIVAFKAKIKKVPW